MIFKKYCPQIISLTKISLSTKQRKYSQKVLKTIVILITESNFCCC